jgi:hypothetical protein
MTSHELARRLLSLPDLPVATAANNHVYASVEDRQSHGPLNIGRLEHYSGDYIVIGNVDETTWPKWGNWHVAELYPEPSTDNPDTIDRGTDGN